MSEQQRQLTAPRADEGEIFELCDRQDEEMVLAELAGRVVDTYVYEFNQDGKPVTGLTLPGVNWACREFAKRGEAIRVVSKPEMMPDVVDPEYVVVSILAQRFFVNPETGNEIALDSAVGVKRQWIKRKINKKDGSGNVIGEEIVPNAFFVETAVSKAQRNAKKSLLPTDFIKEMVLKALDIKHGRVQAGPPAPGSAPRGQQRGARAAQQKPSAPQASGAAGPKPQPDPKAAPAPASAAPAPAQPASEQQKPVTGAPAQPAAPQKSPQESVLSMRSRFWVVLREAAGTKEEPKLRALVKALTGTEKVSELQEAVMSKLGPLLRSVAGKQATIAELEGRTVIMNDDAMVLWPEDFQLPSSEAPREAAPPPPATEPPPPPDEERLF